MTAPEIASWIVVSVLVLLVFLRDMVPSVVAGIVFYLLINRTSLAMEKKVSSRVVRPVALLTATLVALAAVSGAIMLLAAILRAQMRNIPALMTKMAEILESTRMWLIGFGGYELFPEAVRDAEDLKQIAVSWLKAHSSILGIAGETFAIATIHIVMGLLLAMMVYLRHAAPPGGEQRPGPLAFHLKKKLSNLVDAFGQVVSAQVMISAINTGLTAVYLLIILPIAGRPLPFSMTIIFITFVCGLIPVLGNLISNTVIVIVSLGTSFATAIASLVFLITIHKLEYVVNSKIIGSKTGSEIWEILLAIIVGEAAFGIQGIILAPVLYTFAKRELHERGLV